MIKRFFILFFTLFFQIIDEYTAVLKIRNATEQKSRYQCKIKEYAIGETEFYVGKLFIIFKSY